MTTVAEIKKIYAKKRSEIEMRLRKFEDIWQSGSEEDIFAELVFCIFTPQSRARSCWDAVETLQDKNLLFEGEVSEISDELNYVRFKNNKAKYLKRARELFTFKGKLRIKPMIKEFDDVYECRDWLVKTVPGYGYKEASHFLRNIGFSENIAILDRHILKNLVKLGVIEEIPASISRKKYFEIEQKMKVFAKRAKIPLAHLDLILWYKETGEIFK
jgi:N-glycosylase/DNA lyase